MSTSVQHLFRAPVSAAAMVRSPLLLFLLIGYVGLASVSIMWAGDPVLAAKRAVVFLVFALTAFALAQAWSLREILYFAMFASATSLILGIGGAIARGDFLPLGADYRFVGFGNPNLHGIEAACLIISSTIALLITTKRRVLFIGLLLFGIGMLIMTKSRTALAGVVMAGGVSALLSVRRGRLVTIGIAVIILAFTLIVFLPDSVTHAHTAVLLGRSAETDYPATLSGRTLLWEDLLYFAADRPWLGYGFDSFWTPTHIAAVSLRRGWVITQSHSGYIEALLNDGVVGAGLLVLTLVTGVRTAIRRYRVTHTALALFAVAMLVWYMTNLLAEAIPEAHFSTLTVMVILAHLALRHAAPDDSEMATAGQP
jgi:exopolysaccharide production protein ExoQ